jgi:alpha-L-rhamnosidase
VDRLVKNIEDHGNHLTTGFLGTPFLLSVLDENGHSDLAFKLLLSDTYPSWGYMVKMGATTWWERWNGDTGDPSMNSYNHYAFGSVMAWVYRRAAGIDTDATGPGYHHLTIHPHFDNALPQLHTEYDSAYGTIISDWKQSDHRFTITIPANTTATVTLPSNKIETIGSGSHTYIID